MMSISASDLNLNECRKFKSIICNNWMPSEDYQAKHPTDAPGANPFLQGYEEPRAGRNDGWVLVEFWTDSKEAVETYITYINKCFAESEPPIE